VIRWEARAHVEVSSTDFQSKTKFSHSATQTPRSQNPEFRSEKIIGRRLKQVNEMREFPVAGDGLEITGLILQLLNSCNS
jgi:hypothetical protein